MGMVCSLLSVSAAQIETLRAKPELAPGLMQAGEKSAAERMFARFLSQMPEDKRAEAEESFHAFSKAHPVDPPEQQGALADFGDIDDAFDLEKSWHIWHFALTGSVGPAHPPNDLLMTGEELGPDWGYGPVRLHGQATVSDFSTLLQSLDPETLMKRLDYDEMNALGIYCMPSSIPPAPRAVYQEDLNLHITEYFEPLRDYAASAAARGSGLLIWIC